ncbi:hypothetical protein ACTPOE_14730 [Castellaniella sp. WN]
MRTPLSLILVLACWVLAAVFGITLLTVDIEQRAIDQTWRVREEYILGSLRDGIEASLAMGLTLEQSSSLQQMIEREKFGVPDIQDISIHSRSGRILYSTDLGLLGSAMPPAWAPGGDRGFWCADDRNTRSCGIGLRDELGRDAGGLVLVAPYTAQAYSLRAWLTRSSSVLAVAALALLVSILGAVLLARRSLRPFLLCGRILRGRACPDDSGDPLIEAARRARERHVACQRALDSRIRRLKELDRAD